MVDQFWERIDTGSRDRNDMKQWDIGEEVFRAEPPRE